MSFDPSVGTEIQKVRPALIVSNDSANQHGSKVSVLPMTTASRSLPILVLVEPDPENGLDRSSLIRVPDISTFDKARLRRRLGRLAPELMSQVNQKLALHLAL